MACGEIAGNAESPDNDECKHIALDSGSVAISNDLWCIGEYCTNKEKGEDVCCQGYGDQRYLDNIRDVITSGVCRGILVLIGVSPVTNSQAA